MRVIVSCSLPASGSTRIGQPSAVVESGPAPRRQGLRPIGNHPSAAVASGLVWSATGRGLENGGIRLTDVLQSRSFEFEGKLLMYRHGRMRDKMPCQRALLQRHGYVSWAYFTSSHSHSNNIQNLYIKEIFSPLVLNHLSIEEERISNKVPKEIPLPSNTGF